MVLNTTFNNIYFSYIVAVSFIGGGNRVSEENHQPAASHRQTLSHNVVPLDMSGIRTHISGDRHRSHI